MPRKCVPVRNMHGYTLQQLIKMCRESDDEYAKTVLSAVIMRLQGVPTSQIARSLGKSAATITNYINRWNELGIDSTVDNRGGSKSSISQSMLEDIYFTVAYTSPRDLGFQRSTWSTRLLKKYIKSKYGKDYSTEWIRKVLIKLGFKYSDGTYKPTADKVQFEKIFNGNK